MPHVHLNIGSNIGESKLLILRAIAEIESRFGDCKRSEWVESEPWGFVSANSFINIGVQFKTEETPQEILKFTKSIEKKISSVSHRDDDGNYKDRELDIDIVVIEGVNIDDENLTIPHKYLPYREFFLIPLNQLMPEWVHPIEKLTAAEMLNNLLLESQNPKPI